MPEIIRDQNKLDAMMALMENVDVGGLEKVLKAFQRPVLVTGAGENACGVVGQSKEVEGQVPYHGSVGSWSEEMESVASSVEGVPVVSGRVREAVSFGGFGEIDKPPSPKSETGLVARYVRTQSARALKDRLLSVGIKLPKSASWHLAIVTYTAATMPVFFTRGKDELRTLAVLGDAVLVAAVAADAIKHGQGLASMQTVRSDMLVDVHLMRTFSDSSFVGCVNFAAGVNPAKTKTGATALEAIFGLVAYYRSSSDVTLLAKHLGLIKS